MRWANEAIFRERLPIPTVDEVLEELNGSTMFSKLDLCWGFHQIELHEELRDTISSITHEKYKDVIRQAIEGTEVAEDLICHGKTLLEHDQRLHKLLTKLEEKNLTLNCEKCTFRMNKNNSLYGKSPFSAWYWTYRGESVGREGGQSSNYTFRSEELSWVG